MFFLIQICLPTRGYGYVYGFKRICIVRAQFYITYGEENESHV